MWRVALELKLVEAAHVAKELEGSIAFEPDLESAANESFVIMIARGHARVISESAMPATVTTRVRVNTALLEHALMGTVAPTPIFEVQGDVTLYQQLFSALAKAPTPSSALNLRTQP